MKCSIGHLIKSNKPYIGVLFIQFLSAIKALFAKAAIAKGMNPYVFVFYRQAFASIALAPFAFFLERSLKNIIFLTFRSQYNWSLLFRYSASN